MRINRDVLYEQVWASPMTVVSAGYNVSATYLARVCQHLNVPRPPRGYWAKLKARKGPKRPRLPDSKPGEEVEWVKGIGVPRAASGMANDGDPQSDQPAAAHGPLRHELVLGVREFFAAARLSEVGYLRPRKRNLVDILVSRETLEYAMETANELFLMLEKRGHRVALASGGDHFRRPELSVHEGQKFDDYNREPWAYNKHMPCGRLGLRVYCPYWRVSWERRWQESMAGELARKFRVIAKDIEAAVFEVVTLRDDAEERAEAERQRWEIERREREREERERSRLQALKDARQQLLAIVQEWSVARSIEDFFEDAERRARELPSDERTAILNQLVTARAVLGGIDALAQFRQWRPPLDA